MGRRRGAKSKLTPATQRKICASLREGVGRCMAARLAGISTATFYSWMEQGSTAKSGIHLEFLEAVLRAEDLHAQELAKELRRLCREASNEGVRLAAIRFSLERRHPDDWAQRKEVRNTGPSGGPIEVEAKVTAEVRPAFTDEQLAAMSAEQLEAALGALLGR